MQNVTMYRAEVDYRREQIAREVGGTSARRAVRAAARRITGRADAA